jgi:transcriptional regulator with XRE-family HTH domain
VSEGSKVSGDDGAGRELAPPFTKHGGYRLPGLKHWRLRRGLRQIDLAQRTDQVPSQLSKIELVQRGCNAALAQRLAEVLEVDLERVMNSIRNGLGMRETEITGEPSRPLNPHFYAIFAQVHNTL